jgi:hypothetical protein
MAATCTVFATGLAEAISRMHVEKMLQMLGNVPSVDLKLSNKTGVRYSFCKLDSIEIALKHIGNLNGKMLSHNGLVAQPANERKEAGQAFTVLSPRDPVQKSKRMDKIDLLKQKEWFLKSFARNSLNLLCRAWVVWQEIQLTTSFLLRK